jgi:hypothetical protein
MMTPKLLWKGGLGLEHPMVSTINRTGYPRQVQSRKESEAMGESTEMILEGFLCEECGSLIDGEEPGFPRKCEDCIE